mmetsp:Transcript_12956/g.22861  ORF Transcript_12956/g.22861 Transcript_12956/m.22861 type:complete len:891 (+) Transcript_12956:156-2828(+)|eukprot:CAMPEP_0119116410 /NCGR_PEP_ID=MMETSP1180-20130426/52268_1 /TAXON_ID=3052 ORGANISM="Chlamydomonas cf sp, Strain CCMP681" /NCGR_SAMPLE_ID=MMETSP1180 /ASSEMBLY_ACC=CAM_ASM_000741 /LENGTH=890 /DNA_ID=CAMNT_0007105553 /DNA_START=156 /DNA_END=2828 /DNA_ORIENTATION=+
MATRNPSLNIRPEVALAAGFLKHHVVAGGEDGLLGPRGADWWTGLHPTMCPGFDAKANVLRSLPQPNVHKYTRQGLLDYFDNCWTTTEVLFSCMQGTETFLRQPYHQLRHPMMFYYGHPAVVTINKFRLAGLLEDGIDQFIEQLYETGVDEMSWDDLSRARDDWPPVAAVTAYRVKAYQVIRQVILEHPALDQDGGWDGPSWAVFMGCEHERIHIETSSVLIRELPLQSVLKPEYWPDYHPSATQPSPALPAEGVDYPTNDLIPVKGEPVVLGKPTNYPSFGWDNEYGTKAISVQPFRASRYKVTNGEFLKFVKSGGYSAARHWSAEGWAWRTFRNVKWPTFWVPNGPQGLHKYHLRTLFNAVEMRWDWPVDANYHEGKAFCAWRTEMDKSPVQYRVITEAEHQLLRNTSERSDAAHVLARGALGDSMTAEELNEAVNGLACDLARNPDVCMEVGGTEAPGLGFNYQLAYGSQSPVTELPPSKKGFHDVFGNAWEWAEDHFSAFSGFKVHSIYEDFSAPCFGGKHQLILGGSFVSSGQLASKFARYQFRPHFHQHASFRVVAPEVDLSSFDTQRYGPENPIVPFMETSCMDCAPPYAGDGPCCSCKRRGAFTLTLAEELLSVAAKHKSTQVLYESDALLAQVLATHYGSADKVFAALAGESGLLHSALHFHKRLAEDAAAWVGRCGRSTGRALDLGCSVGRGTFELTRLFDQVVGMDLSQRVIEVATKLKDQQHFEYDCKVEGDVSVRLSASLDEGLDTSRATFITGDACALPASYTASFDAVVVANLLDRVPDPQRMLQQARAALAPGGVLVLTSPYSWSEEYTDRQNWIGGVYRDGAPLQSADHVLSLLESMGFELLDRDPCHPLLIADHARKFQLLLSDKMVFSLKA